MGKINVPLTTNLNALRRASIIEEKPWAWGITNSKKEGVLNHT